MNFPFKERLISEGVVERTFSSGTDSDELIWHRDREDRRLLVVESGGWQFQMDNSLPVNLKPGQELLVPAGAWHRVIRGNNDLKIIINKGQQSVTEEHTMKLTKARLQQIIREEMAHARHNLGKNAADVDFPIVVGYELLGKPQSEIAYDQDELDSILDNIAPTVDGPGIPYSLDSLRDVEPDEMPMGADIEQLAAGKKIKITKSQPRRIIKEESDPAVTEFKFYSDLLEITKQLDEFNSKLNVAMGLTAAATKQLQLSDEVYETIRSAIFKLNDARIKMAQAIGQDPAPELAPVR